MPLNLGPKSPPIDLSVGDVRSQIAAEWIQIAQRSQWRAYRKLQSLFLMMSSLTTTTSPSPKWGFHMPPLYVNVHISATGDPIYFMFGSRVGFSGDGWSNGAIFDSNKFKMAAAAIFDNSEWPYLRNSSRSTFVARIARSSLREHSFLVVTYFMLAKWVMNVVGVSKVLLCPYRYLEHIMVNSKNSKFNSASTPGSW